MTKPAGEPATLSTTMPGYADSDDGGVGLPQHITTKNNRDIARSVATQTTSDSTGFASGTPENVPKHDGDDEGSKSKGLVEKILSLCRQN